MPAAVSDSSTLIHLAAVGRLVLLRGFYDQVMVPPAVWKEVVEEGRGRPGTEEVKEAARAGRLKVIPPINEALVRLLKRDLDAGEAEAIALALEAGAEVILLDESDARAAAGMYGLSKTGVVGLLIRARLEGKIVSLGHELDQLRRQAGFWIAEDLYRLALQAVGEG